MDALREEETRSARRQLLLVEKHQILESQRKGLISPGAFEELSAEVDARIFGLDHDDEVRPAPAASPKTPAARAVEPTVERADEERPSRTGSAK